MPTVLFLNGFRFIIWLADHEPPHVHVFKNKGEAKVSIGDQEHAPALVRIHRLTKRDARFIWEAVAEHQRELLNVWEKIHGDLDDQQ